MDLELKGKVAVVTGGRQGLGAAICEILAAEGVNVIVNYRSEEENVKAFIEELNKKYNIRTRVIRKISS